jgi:hypothetical protein
MLLRIQIECIRIGDRDIHSPQVEQVGDIRGRAAGHHGDQAHVIAVLHRPRHFACKPHETTVRQAGRQADRPLVHPEFDGRFVRRAVSFGAGLRRATFFGASLGKCRVTRRQTGDEVCRQRQQRDTKYVSAHHDRLPPKIAYDR